MNESLKWCLDKKRKNFKAKLKIQEQHEEGICFLSKASFFKGVFFLLFLLMKLRAHILFLLRDLL